MCCVMKIKSFRWQSAQRISAHWLSISLMIHSCPHRLTEARAHTSTNPNKGFWLKCLWLGSIFKSVNTSWLTGLSCVVQVVFVSTCRSFWDCGSVALDDISMSLGDCELVAGNSYKKAQREKEMFLFYNLAFKEKTLLA